MAHELAKALKQKRAIDLFQFSNTSAQFLNTSAQESTQAAGGEEN
jgi:hypothetical protein